MTITRGLSGSQMGVKNLEKLNNWIGERDTVRDWPKYWSASEGKLNRKLIASACGFGRSVLLQNPAVKDALEELEKRLRASGATEKENQSQGTVPEVQAILEPWLEARMADWEALPDKNRQPNLPSTQDGKVDVREMTRVLGLTRSQEHLFFNHAELRILINTAAEAQGLTPIGSRTQGDADQEVVRKHIARVAGDRNEMAHALAEREAVIQVQRLEIHSLREQLRVRDETGMIFRVDG